VYGTSIRENYAFGVGQSDSETIIGGSQDNGTSIYENGTWFEYSGGDGGEALVHPLNSSWMISSAQGGERYIRKPGQLLSSTTSNINYGSQFFLDPNDHMKLYNFGVHVYVSNEFGLDSKVIGSPQPLFASSTAKVAEAAIAYNNSNIIAISAGSQIKLTDDGGYTWSSIVSNLPEFIISDIAFNPKDDNTIIVTYNNINSAEPKVWMTNNLGSTWSDISDDLNGMPIRTVIIDNTDESNIYLGAEIGVYTKPMNGTNWTLYTNNLPNVTIQEFDINYGTNEIFATTWGRGYWKTDLVGRKDHPKIVKTSITNAPTVELPKYGQHQFVYSTIEYAGTLSKVEVHWSEGVARFDNIIPMYAIGGNMWRTYALLPSDCIGQRIFFKVVATGSNNDTSETYKFTYTVKADQSTLKGDVNKDGFVNVIDALFISQYDVFVRFAADDCADFNTETELCLEHADFNCDGFVDVLDAMFITQCEVDVPNGFCQD